MGRSRARSPGLSGRNQVRHQHRRFRRLPAPGMVHQRVVAGRAARAAISPPAAGGTSPAASREARARAAVLSPAPAARSPVAAAPGGGPRRPTAARPASRRWSPPPAGSTRHGGSIPAPSPPMPRMAAGSPPTPGKRMWSSPMPLAAIYSLFCPDQAPHQRRYRHHAGHPLRPDSAGPAALAGLSAWRPPPHHQSRYARSWPRTPASATTASARIRSTRPSSAPATSPAWRRHLQDQYGGRALLLAPARQNWRLKGNDRMFQGFAEALKAGADAVLLVPGWGQEVARSKALCRRLGIAERVAWLAADAGAAPGALLPRRRPRARPVSARRLRLDHAQGHGLRRDRPHLLRGSP